MSATENFMKMQDVIKSIYACHESTLIIEIRSEKYNNDAINLALQRLLHERKEIAKAYIETKFNSEKQSELIALFSKYNEEIGRILLI